MKVTISGRELSCIRANETVENNIPILEFSAEGISVEEATVLASVSGGTITFKRDGVSEPIVYKGYEMQRGVTRIITDHEDRVDFRFAKKPDAETE